MLLDEFGPGTIQDGASLRRTAEAVCPSARVTRTTASSPISAKPLIPTSAPASPSWPQSITQRSISVVPTVVETRFPRGWQRAGSLGTSPSASTASALPHHANPAIGQLAQLEQRGIEGVPPGHS